MRNVFPEIILVPPGAANYNITAGTAGITQMVTALEALAEMKFGRNATYRLIGEVKCSSVEIEGGPAPSGQKGYLRVYEFTVAGGNLVADNTAMAALNNLNGELKNCYLYDPYTQTAAVVEQGLEGQVDVKRNNTSLKVPAWNVKITLGYHGADTRKILPHTYVTP